VTFDIDANGIVNVSAKDLGTGREQRITITSSTKLSEDEIKQKVQEAEQFAEDDKRRKEEVETRNRAENLIYDTEKSLKELEGTLSEEEKTRINGVKDELKQVLDTGTIDAINAGIDKLTEEFHTISAKMYQKAQESQGQAAGGDADFQTDAGFQSDGDSDQADGAAGEDNVVDADYSVVDEENNDKQE